MRLKDDRGELEPQRCGQMMATSLQESYRQMLATTFGCQVASRERSFRRANGEGTTANPKDWIEP
jgi:hypothetical protein